MTNYPFTCDRCSQFAPTELSHFAPTDSWLKVYPDKQLIHVHFGLATSTEDESTAESQWVFTDSTQRIETDAPGKSFFSVIDLSRADDSELPSQESLALYKKMMSHPQNGLSVFYGASPGLKFFVNMIKKFAKAYEKMKVVETAADAERLYQEWLQEQARP